MTDQRPDEAEPLEHDEFHSSLEVDDSSGWRVFIVPGVLLLFLLGAIAFIVLQQGTSEPDPRIADRLHNAEADVDPVPEAAMGPPVTPDPATATPAGDPAATVASTTLPEANGY